MVIKGFTAAALISLLSINPGRAEDCEPAALANTVQMVRLPNGQNLLPATINGVDVPFLLDTGGYVTQIGSATAQELKLPVHPGPYELYDLRGNISRDQATIEEFSIGALNEHDVEFPVSPLAMTGGLLALNYLERYDIDVDFAARQINFFSPDQCSGSAPANFAGTTGIPMTVQDEHITVPVTVDGRQFDAVLDTGSAYSTLRADLAESSFALLLGTADTPEYGVLNGDPSLKTYSHLFPNVTLGDIVLGSAPLRIIPDVLPGRLAHQSIAGPPLIIGMDILRRLHIYFAFKERQIYLAPAAAPGETAPRGNLQ